MSNSSLLGWEKNFEEYILDPIYGQVGLTKTEYKLIETNVFSRLRNIKQLGFVHKIYPSATHTRFEHSIGTLHMTWNMLKRIVHKLETDGNNEIVELFDEKIITAVRIAALLHDVGHGPFSHSIEGAISNLGYSFDHDILSCILLTYHISRQSQESIKSSYNLDRLPASIRTYRKELSKVIKPEMRELILSIFDLDYLPNRNISKYDKIRYFLHELIKGDIGSDRIDYLLRDTYFTGLGHKFSLSEVLNNLFYIYDEKYNRLILSIDYSGKESVELLLLTRYFHYEFIANNDLNSKYEAELHRSLKKYFDINTSKSDNIIMNKLTDISLSNDWFEEKLLYDEDLFRVLKVNILEYSNLVHRYVFYRLIEDKKYNKIFKNKIINHIQNEIGYNIEDKIYFIFNVGKPKIPILHNYRDSYVTGGIKLSTLVHDNSSFLTSLGKAYIESTNMNIYCTKDILEDVRACLFADQNFYKKKTFLNPIFHSIKKDDLNDHDFLLFALYNLFKSNSKNKILSFKNLLNEFIKLNQIIDPTYSLSQYDYCYDHSTKKSFGYSSRVYNSLILFDVCGYIDFELLYIFKELVNGIEVFVPTYEFSMSVHSYIDKMGKPHDYFPLVRGWKRYYKRIRDLFL